MKFTLKKEFLFFISFAKILKKNRNFQLLRTIRMEKDGITNCTTSNFDISCSQK